MKKLFFLSVIFLVSQFTIHAQNTRFGFTAGSVFANYNSKVDGENDNGNSKTGITAGVMVDIPVSKQFSFQPAINFVQKGSKDEQTLGGVTETVSVNINSIEVPLNFLYNAVSNSGSFFIGAGPSFAFALSGKFKYSDGSNSLSEDIKFGNGDDDDIKGMDPGANFLAGYSFKSGLLFSVNYNAGLTNLSPGSSSDETLKSHYFGIKLGYFLKGKGKN